MNFNVNESTLLLKKGKQFGQNREYVVMTFKVSEFIIGIIGKIGVSNGF
jgi:hypothetical protein